MALSSQFNYVIACASVDGKNLLLDATDRLLPIGILPERCLNGNGYMISEKKPGWIKLSTPPSKVVAQTTLAIDEEGVLKGKLIIKSDGYFARRVRNSYLSKGEAEYLNEIRAERSYQIGTSEFVNIQSLDQSVEEKYDITWEDATGSPGTIYINPMLHLAEKENPFKLEKREYPVDFGSAFEKVFMLSLTVPENYQIDEMPQPKVYQLPEKAGKYLYNIQATGNTINITSMLTVSKGLFAQTEYANLREFFNLVVAKQAEQIVLKKK
jgi:hypothetical protein